MLSVGTTSSASGTIDRLPGEIAPLAPGGHDLLREAIAPRLVDARRGEIAGRTAWVRPALGRGGVRRGAVSVSSPVSDR